ncbi:hypothetical protein CU041_01660 [Thalassospira povalilytica]|uniref:Uncharacterized protein n=1 Tax=Thalassospira povalilytica TaxID=732237 RepID=A0ABX4RD76_9PROT|nr:hypothetical protein CU041_01660 [Thalassospira povalilytica]
MNGRSKFIFANADVKPLVANANRLGVMSPWFHKHQRSHSNRTNWFPAFHGGGKIMINIVENAYHFYYQ